MKCNKPGHIYAKCMAKTWCKIQSGWPRELQEVVKQARINTGPRWNGKIPPCHSDYPWERGKLGKIGMKTAKK